MTLFMMSFLEITGIVGAYQNCIRSVELYGPTNVAPIINRVAKSAEQAVGTASVSFFLWCQSNQSVGQIMILVCLRRWSDYDVVVSEALVRL